MKKPEQILRDQVTQYLKLQYPDVIYKVDLESDMKLTIQAGKRNKQLQKSRGWPDLFIAHSCNGYHGLFIELKASEIHKKDGSLKKSEHLEEQAEMLDQLNFRGYFACFCIGFEQTKAVIDHYFRIKRSIK